MVFAGARSTAAARRVAEDWTMTVIREGGCACGRVRFKVEGEPLQVGLCHCTDCRKATGTAFLHYADWPAAAFSSTGEYATYNGRSFCAHCGSRLFHVDADGAEINLGALDAAPTDLVPVREGWIVRREAWLAPVAGAVQAEGDPPRVVF
jgi:hypothetical protein